MKIIISESQISVISKSLNEEYIGKLRSQYRSTRSNYYDVYKNPLSISKMEPNLRGIVDDSGNLYVVDDSMNVIHIELIEYLNKLGLIPPYRKGVSISVQRYQYTNEFFLSESYTPESFEDMIYDEVGPYDIEEGTKKINEIFKLASTINPQYTFYPEKIDIPLYLYEDFIGHISNPYKHTKSYEMYKNPQSVKRMSPYTRGVIDNNGNIFVVDNANDLTHMHIIKHLFNKNLINGPHVSIMRNNTTNDFYLSALYGQQYDEEDYFLDFLKSEVGTNHNIKSGLSRVKGIMDMASGVNPQFNFIFDVLK